MLLTDGNPNKTEELRIYESAILGVAKTEMIDLEVKLGLATEEITQEILDFILNRSAVGDPSTGFRRARGVSDVVVTRQVKRWHALHTLAIVYRDAYFNQLNDRYKAMFREYRQLARVAKDQTLQYGVGLALNPIPIADAPVFSSTGGADPETLYWVQVAWVSASGSEGEPSEITTYISPSASLPVVGVGTVPSGVTGFNVYMGLTPESLWLQNPVPVEVSGTFALPSTGLVEGAAPGDGQAPDVYLTGGPTLRRG